MTAAHSPRLERLLQPLERVEIDAAGGNGQPAWLTTQSWRLLARVRSSRPPQGEVFERFFLASGECLDAVRREDDGRVHVPFDLEEAYANYVTESWRTSAPPRALNEILLGSYYRLKRLLPRSLWLHARRAYIRLGRPPEFPAWPLEVGVERLLHFYSLCILLALDADEARFAWFWPDGHRAAVVLTHDVESSAGLRLALELADLEEERGLRSSFNIVGEGYEIDVGILSELSTRGFEIGLHGLHHDRSLFSSRAEFERQLPRLAAAAQRLDAVGFRSPATFRAIEWLHELPVSYDCSVPHSDPYEPQPGGCCTLWPYMLGDVVELPYTLPQDHTLFTLLSRGSARLWLEQLDAIERRFGLIQCLSHPDPGYLGDRDKRAIYIEFLDVVAERDGLWKALPRAVAAWWRRREAGETEAPEQLPGVMRRTDTSEYVTFEPPAR